MRVQIGFGIELDKHGNPVGYCPMLEREIVHEATKQFGGATIFPCIGAWKSGKGEIVSERGRILQIDAVPYERLGETRQLAAWIKEQLRQKSVVYSVQNIEAEFI